MEIRLVLIIGICFSYQLLNNELQQNQCLKTTVTYYFSPPLDPFVGMFQQLNLASG